jgi:hypothetical protein
MAALVTLEQAKTHLGIPLTLVDNDADVTLKISHASDTVLNYLKHRADPDWTSDTVPGDVQHATLVLVTHFFENRGNDMRTDEDVWKAVERLLVRYRDPALA